MTKEFCDANNGREVMCELTWMSKPCHALVLLDVEKGGSIKPYFESEEEKDRIIRERCVRFGQTYENCKRHIEKPTYCFRQIHSMSTDTEIQEVIDNVRKGDGFYAPVCPFA